MTSHSGQHNTQYHSGRPQPVEAGTAEDAGATVELTVDRLGAQGDGLAQHGGGLVYIPYAAPGDRLRVRLEREAGRSARGQVVARLADGAARRAPACHHFETCGGCAVQHITGPEYAAWKRGLVVDALGRHGLDAGTVTPLRPGTPGARRRVRFQARREAGGVTLGFFAVRSRRIVDIAACPVLRPELVSLALPLRALFAALLPAGARGDAAATLCANGIDLTLGLAAAPDQDARARLADFAGVQDLARLSWRPVRAGHDAEPAEPLVVRRAPVVHFGSVAVRPPPDSFVQPTEDGETLLRREVDAAITGAERVADLYAGCGAFSLSAALAGIRIAAFDAAGDSIAALLAAARAGGFGERVTAEARDLNRRLLTPDQLDGFDAVVLDPPRPGADAQVRALASSTVPVIAYVSCAPLTFARDACTLTRGGYRLDRVAPVDQFLWTRHVELVGVFSR